MRTGFAVAQTSVQVSILLGSTWIWVIITQKLEISSYTVAVYVAESVFMVWKYMQVIRDILAAYLSHLKFFRQVVCDKWQGRSVIKVNMN